MNTQPVPGEVRDKFISAIAFDIIVTLITCGIYNLFVQHRQMKAVNYLLKSEKYNFWLWLLLTIVTCGIYHIYHEYILTKDICSITERKDQNEVLMILVLSIFGLTIVADAIQQHLLNEYLEKPTS